MTRLSFYNGLANCKAAGELNQGGSSWDQLLGAKQTGPLLSVCSFAGVSGDTGFNLLEA
jgi:hypothetical protein